eukprot:EG_transcript_48427
MTRSHASGELRRRVRAEVLAYAALVPRPFATAIARAVGERLGRNVNEATVRYILKGYDQSGDVNERSERKRLASRLVGKRFSSCDELWTALQREWSQAP